MSLADHSRFSLALEHLQHCLVQLNAADLNDTEAQARTEVVRLCRQITYIEDNKAYKRQLAEKQARRLQAQSRGVKRTPRVEEVKRVMQLVHYCPGDALGTPRQMLAEFADEQFKVDTEYLEMSHPQSSPLVVRRPHIDGTCERCRKG